MPGRPATREVSVVRVLPLDAGDAWDLLGEARIEVAGATNHRLGV